MKLPALYLDEDAQSEALIHALRARGMDTLTTTEAGMANRTDEDQLAFARDSERVLLTYNVGDFAKMHAQWAAAGRSHAGIILVQQQKWGPGELARRIIRLLSSVPPRDVRNNIHYVGNW